jgi:hypothetical protein
MNHEDEIELRALVITAMDLRGGPYFRDACEAIVDWHERRHLRALERRHARDAALVRLMRETDPYRNRAA